MYDSSTADLIRNAPPLRGLDRAALPDMFTQEFAKLAAIRVRLRAGEVAAEDLDPTRQLLKRLAQTNEVLVALGPDRENRRSAAFVAGTAYQLIFQIDVLSGVNDQHSRLTEDAITADISAMILFLVAESSADAADVSQRVLTTEDGIEQELLRTLVDVARGRISSINGRPLPSPDLVVQSATDALYYHILRGVRSLASILAGRPTSDDPSTILRRTQMLASQADTDRPQVDDLDLGLDPLRQTTVALFPGPYHLASLLLPAVDTLLGAATINVPPPADINGDEWLELLVKFARHRPFLWPNHRDAISKLYLQGGTSSVVSFPTGSGKSAVFQLKIGATLLGGRRVVFLAPTHALVNQTRRDLQEAFPDAQILGEQADDFDFLDSNLPASDVLVMTPESCLFLQHMDSTTFEQVGLLVFDECHLMHPRTDVDRRSIDAMLCLLNLVRLAPDADLVLLSAMMQNTNEVAAWVADLTQRKALAFSMAWKPTRQLRGCVVYEERSIKSLNEILHEEKGQRTTKSVPARVKQQLRAKPYGFFSVKQTWASRDREDYSYVALAEGCTDLGVNKWWRLTPNAGVLAAELATKAALAGVNTLVFSQSIPLAAKVASRIADALGPRRVELSATEKRLRFIASDEMGEPDKLYVDVKDDVLVVGAAAHHGLLLPEERLLIESLFRRPNGLSVLSATSTVSQGMNSPSQLVIIAEDSRFNEQTGRKELLEARELLNAAGRAGRAGQATTGLVVVIPGSVVGFDEQQSKIGSRWGRLREIFSQTDQCLVIDDPLAAVLDRIHDETQPSEDLERYVVSRLCGVGEEGDDPMGTKRDAVGRTFGAFRRRQDVAWVESRTASALALLENSNVDDANVETIRRLSSSLGLPEDVLSALRVDVLDVGLRGLSTLAEWRHWVLGWMAENPGHAIRMFRAEDLKQQFGSSLYGLDDDARLRYALPRLEEALVLWMSGEPLTAIQPLFGMSSSDVRKSIGARKFVVRLLPALAPIFSALPRIIAENEEAGEHFRDSAPSLFFLNRCVRLGFSSLEMYALYEHVRESHQSRREIHRRYEAVSEHIPSPPSKESWPDLKRRVAKAYDSVKAR